MMRVLIRSVSAKYHPPTTIRVPEGPSTPPGHETEVWLEPYGSVHFILEFIVPLEEGALEDVTGILEAGKEIEITGVDDEQ
jgi:hypothetical protein